MTQETRNLVINYIKHTLDPVYGISEKALEFLELLVLNDKDMARDLESVMENISVANNTYFLYPKVQDHIRVNQEHFERVSKIKNDQND